MRTFAQKDKTFIESNVKDLRFIKIYGLQRSGTNYLEWLLNKNLASVKVLVDETGWKHGYIPATFDVNGLNWSPPYMDEQEAYNFAQRRLHRLGDLVTRLEESVKQNDLCFTFISKDPYSWYASYARFEGLPYSPIDPKILEYWCLLNRHWYEFSLANKDRCYFLRYADLLAEPEVTLARVCTQLNLRFSEQDFINCQDTLSMFGGQAQSGLFRSDYYQNKEYLAEFSPQDMALFATTLPPDLLAKLEYTIEPVNNE